jgi:hypothetical protein
MKFDPLDFDPSRLSFSASEPAAAEADASSVPADGEPSIEAVETATEEVAPPVAAPVIDRSLTVQLGPMPDDSSVSPRRTAEQLSMQLESLKVADMPLQRFVEVVSDLADVGVTLDPHELELAGVVPTQPISIDAKETSVEALLRDVLAKQRLDLMDRDGRIGIALSGADRRKAVVYDVADLAGDADATPLARMIERFVEPESWKPAGGTGAIAVEGAKLRIEQTQRVRHELLIFIERLRLARGLSQRSRYPAAMLRVTSPYERLTKLNERTTFTFLPWARLGDVFRYWEEFSGITVLVDWHALADLELQPSSHISCSANERSWTDALDGILEPLGLGWWAVNAETIQITIRERLADIQRVEFYTVTKQFREQFASSSALVESLQTQIWGTDANEAHGAEPPVIQLDEPSGRLIVRATPDEHRLLAQRLQAAANQPVAASVRTQD